MSNYPEPNVIPSQEYEELIDAYKLMHKDERAFMGISLIPLTYIIKSIFEENKVKSFLDYGCGKGLLYTKDFKKADKGSKYPDLKEPIQDTFGITEFSLYDPAYPEHAELPTKQYDAVISTDVLEHVPSQDLDWVMDKIYSHATKIVFLNVCGAAAIKTFPEGKHKGRNVHVSLFDNEWWVNQCHKIRQKHKHLKIYLTWQSTKGIVGTCIKGEEDGTTKSNRSSDKTAG